LIAYSAIDSGVRPFGDKGIQAFFNDANEIGALVSRSDVASQETDAARLLVAVHG
jgi:hypothetical protein